MTATPDPLPDIARPDAGTILVSPWIVGTPERQRAAVDATIAGWERVPWPEAFLSLSCFASTDGETVLNYAQWTSDEAHREFVRTHRPALVREIDDAVPGIERPPLHQSEEAPNSSKSFSSLTSSLVEVLSVRLPDSQSDIEVAVMKQIYPDLWQTVPEHPFPDFPRVSTHAYLLVRDGGNVLFYSSGHSDDYRHIRELGGISHQYLSHRDEAGPPLARIKQTFGSKLCCHRLEEAAVSEACPVDLTFDSRGTHLGDIEVIPTPGHTPGSTCFFVRSPHGRAYLFTGDTIFPNDDTWNTLVQEIGSKSDLKQSLQVLRGLEPDVVLSSASVGTVAFKEMSAGEWHEVVDGALRDLS